MKKLQTSLLAVAALAGVGAAFAFKAPNKKFFFNVVYAKRIGATNPQFTYSTVQFGGLGIGCKGDPGSSCTFTTTKTVAFFNSNNQNTFPTQVHYLSPDQIYK
jgi:hypothetical protein